MSTSKKYEVHTAEHHVAHPEMDESGRVMEVTLYHKELAKTDPDYAPHEFHAFDEAKPFADAVGGEIVRSTIEKETITEDDEPKVEGENND